MNEGGRGGILLGIGHLGDEGIDRQCAPKNINSQTWHSPCLVEDRDGSSHWRYIHRRNETTNNIITYECNCPRLCVSISHILV